MGLKVTSYESLGIGDFKYIYTNGVMYRAMGSGEQHRDILAKSGLDKNMVLVAGGYTVTDNQIMIDGEGSMTLKLDKKDATPVAEFVKSLPDIGTRKVWSM